ncbi:MAG: transaldolase [Candidatus Dormibacteraceae bacterium]
MTVSNNPIVQLRELGQSPWCDQLSRELLESGRLARMIQEQGITGLTSNPTIFHKAMSSGHSYDVQIHDAASRGVEVKAIYEELAVRDIQEVADLLRPVYDQTNQEDGFVSLEVSPDLAYDMSGSVLEGRRLWATVDRPNVMIKIPGTRAGLPAVTALLAEGINVNVTLVFGLRRYRAVLEAHAEGLLQAKANGLRLPGIASVASFFVSRVDTLVDRLLDLKAGGAANPVERERLRGLKGQAAIANAKAARVCWEIWRGDEPMRSLLAGGAQPQRLLWASTSTKNPDYRDVVYVEELIGPDTVNTMPMETIAAFADHGCVRGATVCAGVAEAAAVLTELSAARIKMETVADELESNGVRLFAESFTQLLDGLRAKSEALRTGAPA